jgi:hypothetical protein
MLFSIAAMNPNLPARRPRSVNPIGRPSSSAMSPGPDTADHLTAAAVRRLGRVDVLVNNAGIFHTKPFTAYTVEELDLAHLGLGPDGHTASLVPGDPVLNVTDVDVALTGVYQGRRRMTLTYPILSRTRRILWLVTGPDKVAALALARGRSDNSSRSDSEGRCPDSCRPGGGRTMGIRLRCKLPKCKSEEVRYAHWHCHRSRWI